MGGIGRPAGRTAALLALVVIAAVSLRGYLPAADAPLKQEAAGGTASFLAVHFLLGASVLILLMAVVASWNQRKTRVQLPIDTSSVALDRRTVAAVLVIGVLFVAVFALLGRASLGAEPEDTSDATSEQDAADAGDGGPTADVVEPVVSDEPTLWPTILVTGLLLLVIATAGVVIAARKPVPDLGAEPTGDDTEGGEESVSESLARAAELGLAAMSDPDRDPRTAIIACYTAMERALSAAPEAAPLASDTPTEVLARAVGHGVLHSGAAAELVGLFTEARFSQHRMTEADRESAIGLLRLVSDDLRSPL
jgi:hypothetical protein